MDEYKVTTSTELMRNYLQSEVVAPDAKFRALQAPSGTALLFSTSTERAFLLTREVPGDRSGWQRVDLSKALLARDFADRANAGCKDFAVAATVVRDTPFVRLALVVNDGTSDHLYLSTVRADARWDEAPEWRAYPYDGEPARDDGVRIVGLSVSEASDAEYVVVDVLRDPKSGAKLVTRYFLDVTKAGGRAWHPHDLPTDLETDGYTTCLGRAHGQRVDGLYTKGHVRDSAQIVYRPLYNVYDRGQAARPHRLELADRSVPDAIACCRLDGGTTDLYAVANGRLHLFADHNQNEGAKSTPLLESPLFTGVRDLFAEVERDTVTVWGRNQDLQVFYTSCPHDRIADPAAWSVPLPILGGVEQVSPYVDRTESANTFFAHTGANELVKAVKSPVSRMWTTQHVTLPPPEATTPARRFDSYTTRIHVETADGKSAANTVVALTSSTVKGFHVNHRYYVLGGNAVHVRTDSAGAVTVVEKVDTLAGARLTVEMGGVKAVVNPMDKPIDRLARLDHADKLANARITDPDGTTRRLVPEGVSDAHLAEVAEANTHLAAAYRSLASAPVSAPVNAESTAYTAEVLVDAGDLFASLWEGLKKGVRHVVRLVRDELGKAWHFVVAIGKAVYRAVLDTVETVVGAVQWIYQRIRTAIEDVVDFLKFLFEWKDITRTKQVIQNLVRLYLYHQVDRVAQYRNDCDALFGGLRKTIDGWTGLPSSWDGLGDAGKTEPQRRSTPSVGQDAPGSFVAHHYQGNADRATGHRDTGHGDLGVVGALVEALKKEADILGDTFVSLRQLAAEAPGTPLAVVLVKLVGIVADAAVASAQTVVHALLDVIQALAVSAIEGFDAPIHIPVVSDILEDFGVPEFSFLDIVCWIAAIPATLVYKAAKGVAPFPDNDDTRRLIDAKDLESLKGEGLARALFSAAPNTVEARGMATLSHLAPTLPKGVSDTVFIAGHGIGGFCTLMATIVSGFEAAQESPDNPWSIPSAVLGVVGGAAGGIANYLVPCEPVDNKAVSDISTVVTGIRLVAKVIFCGPVQKRIGGLGPIGKLAVTDGRGTGAVVDAALALPALACTIWHFGELAAKPAGGRHTVAILDETANVVGYIGRFAYAIAVNDPEPETKSDFAAAVAVANLCGGGLQTAEMFINRET